MGLLYVFPVETNEEDFVILNNETITVKTYGLPYIFWIYALCCIAVVFFMFLAIKEPVLKLVSLGDETDATLGYTLLSFIGLIPVGILAFFFYEKRLSATKGTIKMQHRIFGLPILTETFPAAAAQLSVESFLTSPNVARMKGAEGTQGFQNKGYFCLWLEKADKKRVLLDRHSRKVDLEKLKSLLELRL